MARQFSLIAQAPERHLLSPAADAAGRTGVYRSLKNAIKAYVVVSINQGNAATVLLSVLQASAVAGTGSKAISATSIWANQDEAAADGDVAQTAAATFTTSATLKQKRIIFEIVPEQCMDVANGFDCITVSTGASNAANITSAHLVIIPAYQQASPPNTLVD